MTKGFELSLKSDALNAFKTDFNSMLKHTLYTMEQKEGEVATISVTFKISLTRDTAPDPSITAYEAEREVIIPKIKHTLRSLIQITDKRSGSVGGEKYELVWDKDAHEYFMREIKDAPTLFDYMDDDPETDDETVVEAVEEVVGEVEDVPTEELEDNPCEAWQDGSCPIVNNCDCCCRDCEETEGCLGICAKYSHRATPRDVDSASEFTESVEV